MRKDLKKNKKGFTLVEIIVVLLIIGILLAITIPSIMGYVGKAKDAQYEAEARTGFLGAQTLTARLVAEGKTEGTGTSDKQISDEITLANIEEETGSDSVTYIKCNVEANPSNKLDECMIETNASGKYVYFKAGKSGKAGETTVYDSQEKAKDAHSTLFD